VSGDRSCSGLLMAIVEAVRSVRTGSENSLGKFPRAIHSAVPIFGAIAVAALVSIPLEVPVPRWLARRGVSGDS
jgi:hypothetical protein